MSPNSTPLFRLHAHAFVAGLLLSFGLLVLAGHAVSQSNYIDGFKRFHRRIGLETYFYPSSSLLQSIATKSSDQNQTLVLIGGSSVFNGVKQPRDQLWTDFLQSELGPEFRVYNFAFRGSYPTDSGAIAAEILRKQGRKVIYVADLAPGTLGEPDGRDIYRYLFWDAEYKGLLFENSLRNEYLKNRVLSEEDAVSFKEMQRAMWINSYCYSVDLWNYVTYSFFSTIWSSSVSPFFFPRRVFRDSEKEPLPISERYLTAFDEEMKTVRGPIQQFVKTNGSGQVSPDLGALFNQQADVAFRKEDRANVILVTTGPSPFYTKKMSDYEQEQLRSVYAEQQRVQEASGFQSLNATGKFGEEDYGDRCHLGPSGGKKLAALVARKILDLPPPKSLP